MNEGMLMIVVTSESSSYGSIWSLFVGNTMSLATAASVLLG